MELIVSEMKKVAVNLIVFLFVFSAFIHFSLAAANSTACDPADENCKIDKEKHS